MYPAAAEGSKQDDDMMPWTGNENHWTCACLAAIHRGGPSPGSASQGSGDLLPAV